MVVVVLSETCGLLVAAGRLGAVIGSFSSLDLLCNREKSVSVAMAVSNCKLA